MNLPIAIAASWVLVCDEDDELELLADHVVAVEADRIADIVPAASVSDAVDGSGHLLRPGLLSGHTHVAGGTVTRGIIEGGRSYARPRELVEELDDEELDAPTAARQRHAPAPVRRPTSSRSTSRGLTSPAGLRRH